jgi:hypothetical protein
LFGQEIFDQAGSDKSVELTSKARFAGYFLI